MYDNSELQTLRVSSADYPEGDRFEAFREQFGRAIMRIEMEPIGDSPFEVNMQLRMIPGLGIASGTFSATRNSHTSSMIDNDDLVLVMVQDGSGSMRQNGREASVETGQGILTANGSPGVFFGHRLSHLFNVRLDRSMLTPRVVALEAALLRPIQSNSPVLQLMKTYARVLEDSAALSTVGLRRAVTVHMHDLAALLLGATRDGAEIAKGRGVRAARLHAVKEAIVANLSQRNLSAASLATSHGVSPGYIRKLFEADGTTFTDFVLAQRLTRAYEMLEDPRLSFLKIGGIAFEVGFGDLSYFNNSFRRRFGKTPSDVRHAAVLQMK
jgi:AraC-like DNA-binding protein